jgi:hypothetical protein
MTTYDTIGAATRPFGAPIHGSASWRSDRDARSVINVGAGTGSDEPPQTVLAVNPVRDDRQRPQAPRRSCEHARWRCPLRTVPWMRLAPY